MVLSCQLRRGVVYGLRDQVHAPHPSASKPTGRLVYHASFSESSTVCKWTSWGKRSLPEKAVLFLNPIRLQNR